MIRHRIRPITSVRCTHQRPRAVSTSLPHQHISPTYGSSSRTSFPAPCYPSSTARFTHRSYCNIRSFHSTVPKLAISPFKLHDIGEGITEVEIIKWYVQDGQEVGEFDALCEVQSDKSVVELTSHADGIVRGIKKSAGETVKVGQVLCEIHTPEQEPNESDGGLASAAREDVNANQANEGEDQTSQVNEEDHDQGQGQNEGESPQVNEAEILTENLEKSQEPGDQDQLTPSINNGETRRHPLHPEEDPIQLSGEASILPSPPRLTPTQHSTPVQARQNRSEEDRDSVKRISKASPAIRTLAGKMGIDLGTIQGTGENGRITKNDLEDYAGSPIASDRFDREKKDRGKMYRVDSPEYTRVEFGRTRKIMFRALGEQGKIPHFGYSHTLNLTPLLPYLKASNPPHTPGKGKKGNGYLASDIPSSLVVDPIDEEKQKTTILSFLVKGLILALQEHPIMRTRVKEEGGERWLEVARDGVIGVAVSDPKYGLLTPSLPPLPPSTPLSSITSHLHSLRHAPNKPSTPANLTISSVGGLGEAKGAMPILPPGGGLAICAVGRARWEMEWARANGDTTAGRSVWEMDEGQVREGGSRAVLRAGVGWSGNHRILEGAELIAFTETWKRYIEEPWRWINVTL